MNESAPSGPLAPTPGTLPVAEWARRLAVLLDSAIRIPGTDIRIGLDPILGAVLPELGDALSALLSLALLAVAFRQRATASVVLRMLLNIAIDAILGAIPLLGDVFDFSFKANEKNLALLERHRSDPTRALTWGDRLLLAGAAVVALALVLLPLVVGIVLGRYLLSR